MGTYIRGGAGDVGVAIIGGLLIGLIAAAAFGSDSPPSKKVAEPKKPDTVQQVKVEDKPKTKNKEDCTFWRTMAFANTGKSMWSYYYTQWQACEARNER